TSLLGLSTLMSRGHDRLIPSSARVCRGRNKSARGYCPKSSPPADSGPRRLLSPVWTRISSIRRPPICSSRKAGSAFGWRELMTAALHFLRQIHLAADRTIELQTQSLRAELDRPPRGCE